MIFRQLCFEPWPSFLTSVKWGIHASSSGQPPNFHFPGVEWKAKLCDICQSRIVAKEGLPLQSVAKTWCLMCMSSLTADFVINSFSKLLLKFKFQNSCYKKYRWSTLSNSRISPQSSQLWSVYWLSFQTISYAFISILYIQINTPFWGVFLSLQTSSLILMQLAFLIKNMAWKKYVFEIFLNQYLEIYFLVFNCDMLNIL